MIKKKKVSLTKRGKKNKKKNTEKKCTCVVSDLRIYRMKEWNEDVHEAQREIERYIR